MGPTKKLSSFALFLALVASVSACNRSTSSPLRATDYIAIAMESSEGATWDPRVFPQTVGTQKCVLHLGPPEAWIPGRCSTSVTLDPDGDAVVRFMERWDARDFSAGSPSERRHLTHTWEIAVSQQAPSDHVVQIRHYGDFPPQLTR